MLGWACAAPIHAAQSDFGVGLGLTYDTNIGRTETNPQREWIESLIAGLSYQQNTADVTARVLTQVERRYYTRHTNTDETSGFLDGSMVWTLSPRQLAWTVEDVFREIKLDIAAPNTPSNLTNSNALSTGPDFTLPLSSTNKAVFGGRYGRIDIDNSNTDTQRYTAYVRGLHMLSPQTTLSLNYEAARVYFEPGAQPFEKLNRQDWFGRFENRSAMNSATIDLGTSRVTPYGIPANCELAPAVTPNPLQCSALPASQSSRLVRLTLAEALSAQSTLRASLSDQISDTYSDLIAVLSGSTLPTDVRITGPSTPNAPTAPAFVSADSYRSKTVGLGYANNNGHFVYTLQGYDRHVDFVTLDEDFHERAAVFDWTWLYSGAMSFNVSVGQLKRTFDSLDRQDRDRGLRAGIVFRLNRNVTFTMQGDHTERQSTVPLNSFVDSRVMLLLGYSTGPAYQVQTRR